MKAKDHGIQEIKEPNNTALDPGVDKCSTEEVETQLDRAVENARILLKHAAHLGLELDRDTIENIVRMEKNPDPGSLTTDIETKFWIAYQDLTELVTPVTIESIRTVKSDPAETHKGLLSRLSNRAHRTVIFYIVFAVFNLILVGLLQTYWVVGAKLISNISSLKDEVVRVSWASGLEPGQLGGEQRKVILEMETNREALILWYKPLGWILQILPERQKDKPYWQTDFELEIQYLTKKLKKARKDLEDIKLFDFQDTGLELAELRQKHVDILTEDILRKIEINEKRENEQGIAGIEISAKFILLVLQRYLLPIMYGFLGVSAYILRSLIVQIQELKYTVTSGINHRLRMFMGGLAGLMIGWFASQQGDAALTTLSPLALSFLIGYNIEVLFSILDRYMGKAMRGQTRG